MKALTLLLTLTIFTLSGCGFHMRGSSLETLGAKIVYIQGSDAKEISARLRSRLALDDVIVTAYRNKADLVITLTGEAFDRRVLSVDANTGKVREFELGYEVILSASRAGKEILPADTLSLLRDFTFDETAVLGTFQEEAVLRYEITEDAADMVLRRIQAVTSGQ